MLEVALARLGDVDRQIADALEIGVDLDRGHDGPQIGGHRLVERQQLEAAIVQLDVEIVDRLVAGQHGLQRLGVALDDRHDGDAHPFLGQAAHCQQPLLQRLELLLEMPDDSFHSGSAFCLPASAFCLLPFAFCLLPLSRPSGPFTHTVP